MSADEYTAQLMSDMLDASGDRVASLERFAGRLDAADAAAMRDALRQPDTWPATPPGN